MKKTVLFVPGFREDLNSRDYASLLESIKQRGYDIEFIYISWNRTTIHDWAEQLRHEYEKYDARNIILAGFSFGALTSFVVASGRPPAALWLFSLSPFFAEDLPNIKKWELAELGKCRVQAAKESSFRKLAKKVSCPVMLFVGSEELSMWPEMQFRFEQASSELGDVLPIIVDGVGHAIENLAYRETIIRNIRN